MKKPKEYEIENIQDIADSVNAENIDNFLVDLKGVLIAYLAVKTVNPSAKFPSFIWIDDQKHEINLKFQSIKP